MVRVMPGVRLLRVEPEETDSIYSQRMWYFILKVSPKPNKEMAKEAGGAYVNCWINFRERELAPMFDQDVGILHCSSPVLAVRCNRAPRMVEQFVQDVWLPLSSGS